MELSQNIEELEKNEEQLQKEIEEHIKFITLKTEILKF